MNTQNDAAISMSSSPMQARSASIWTRYNSPIVWPLLVAYLGLTAFLVTVVFPIQFVDRSHAGFFEPQGVIAIEVMGLIGVWLSMHTGFPNAWDANVSSRQLFCLQHFLAPIQPVLGNIDAGVLLLRNGHCDLQSV